MRKTKHFSAWEFLCRCCGVEHMVQAFVDRLEVARVIAGIVFRINSGWRCKKRNKEIGGSRNSSHMIGRAADINIPGLTKWGRNKNRWIIVTALLEAGFNRIGIAEKFIHVDDDPAKPAGVIWLYCK